MSEPEDPLGNSPLGQQAMLPQDHAAGGLCREGWEAWALLWHQLGQAIASNFITTPPSRDRARSLALGLHSETMKDFWRVAGDDGERNSKELHCSVLESKQYTREDAPYHPAVLLREYLYTLSIYPLPTYISSITWASKSPTWRQVRTVLYPAAAHIQLVSFTPEMCPDLCRERILAVEKTTTEWLFYV